RNGDSTVVSVETFNERLHRGHSYRRRSRLRPLPQVNGEQLRNAAGFIRSRPQDLGNRVGPERNRLIRRTLHEPPPDLSRFTAIYRPLRHVLGVHDYPGSVVLLTEPIESAKPLCERPTTGRLRHQGVEVE